MNRPRVSMQRIKSVVAAEFGVPVSELLSHRRHKRFIDPRHAAIYLACNLTPFTSGTIGKHFGDRDHSTILHAHKRIAGLRDSDRDFDRRIRRIEEALEPPQTLQREIQLAFLIGPLFDRDPHIPKPRLRRLEAA